METARQVPGATIQIQTSADQTINRSWKIKTIALECETAFKYELAPTLKRKNIFLKLIISDQFFTTQQCQDLFSRFRDTVHALTEGL